MVFYHSNTVCILSCPGTPNFPASVSLVLGFQICTTMPCLFLWVAMETRLEAAPFSRRDCRSKAETMLPAAGLWWPWMNRSRALLWCSWFLPTSSISPIYQALHFWALTSAKSTWKFFLCYHYPGQFLLQEAFRGHIHTRSEKSLHQPLGIFMSVCRNTYISQDCLDLY